MKLRPSRLLASLAVLCIASITFAQQLAFCVSNPSGLPVGTVSLVTSTSATIPLVVSNETSACASIPASVSSVIINGQQVVRPNTGIVSVGGGVFIGIRWVGTSYIEVFDPSEMNLGR